MSILKTKHWVLFLGLLSQLAAVSLAYGAAGRFQFVVGDVRVTDVAGKERPARKGGEVNEGESILSGASGSAQIVMVDGGILAVRPDTQMKIDQYKYNGKEDGSERSFFSVVKGGFRSITGAIGKTHKENYGIKTPAATIGIRGTDSETVHVVVPLPAVPEGTYNKVNQGSTVMNGTAIAPNQVGYTPNLSSAAVILPAMPPIFEPPKPGQGPKKDQKEGGAGDKSGEKKDQQKAGDSGKKNGETASTQNGQQQSGDNGSGSSSTASPTTSGSATSTIAATTTTTVPPTTVPIVTGGTVTGGGVVPSTQFVDAPIGAGGVGSEISFRTECVGSPTCTPVSGWWAGAGSMVREAGKTQTMLLNTATGMPVLLAEQGTTDNFLYSAGTATVQGFGQDSVGGVKVSWGRYVGADTMVNDKGIAQDPLVMNMAWTDSALNFIQADSYVTSLAAAKSFSTTVGGSVTDELGNVYSSFSGTLTIQYPSKDLSLNISASIPGGRSWNLSYGNVGEGIQKFYGGGCSPGTPCGLGLLPGSTYNTTTNIITAGGKGEAHGVLIGSGGSVTGALTSFSATVPGTAAISGAIVLK